MFYLSRPSLAKTYAWWSRTESQVVLKGPERHSGLSGAFRSHSNTGISRSYFVYSSIQPLAAIYCNKHVCKTCCPVVQKEFPVICRPWRVDGDPFVYTHTIRWLQLMCRTSSGAVLWKVWPLVPPPTARSKVSDAGILLNYVVIASNVCERRFMSIVFNFTLLSLVSL